MQKSLDNFEKKHGYSFESIAKRKYSPEPAIISFIYDVEEGKGRDV